MKKITVISNTAFSIEKFRLHYLKRLSDYIVDMYTPHSKVKINSDIKNLRSKIIKSNNLLDELLMLNKIINKNINSIFFVFSFKYQFLVGLIRLTKSFKIVSLIAGKGYLFYKKNITNILIIPFFKLIFKKFNKIICINPMDKKFFNNYLNTSIKLIPTEGIDHLFVKNKINKKKNFIYFSRIIKEKGINEFLYVARHFKKKNKNLNFYISGPLRNVRYIGQSSFFSSENYKKKLKQNKKYVTYLGHQKKFEKILPKMDCLISPSYTEGAGTSVMESLISGLFVIAYKNNGHNFVLKGTNNILCDQNIPSLINSVEKYLNLDKKQLQKIALQSKNRVLNNFSSKIVSKKVKAIIDSC